MRLSDILDRPVFTEQGEVLGHVFDVRATNDGDAEPGSWTGRALVAGRVGALERLGLPGLTKLRRKSATGAGDIAWEDVVAIEEDRIVVRDDTTSR